MKSILYLCEIIVGSELIYNLSSLANCYNLHLLISDSSNMSLIHVSHARLILFLLIVVFIFFGVYFLSNVSPIRIFPSTVIAPKNLLGVLVI